MRYRRRIWRALALVGLITGALPVWAGGCDGVDPMSAKDLASRIAAVACRENRLWHEPFIDSDGRLASITVAEMETARLSDGMTPAWKRVVDYWRGSGLLRAVAQRPGASTCEYVNNDSYASPNCRGFLIDTPWSAAFVSYVLVHAGVPGFNASPSHVDYVRDAYLHPESSPFTISDPLATPPSRGDLLCFIRSRANGIHGLAGLMTWLGTHDAGALPMHCDIVVDANGSGDNRAYLVGGNVLQGVTLRILPLNRIGTFWNLPQGQSVGCSPGNPGACNFNRQNWVALLKLKPALSGSRPPMRTLSPARKSAPAQRKPECCVHCVVGSGVPRCPATDAPSPGP